MLARLIDKGQNFALALDCNKTRQKHSNHQAPCGKKVWKRWESLLENIPLKTNSNGSPLGICAQRWEFAKLSIIHIRTVLICE